MLNKPSKTPYAIGVIICWIMLGWFFIPFAFPFFDSRSICYGFPVLCVVPLIMLFLFILGLILVITLAGVIYKAVEKYKNRRSNNF
jgi:hypothetical protein